MNRFPSVSDEAMDRLVQSIKEYGVHEPCVARPKIDENGNFDGYELLIGNRRKMACELARLSTMPIIIREFDAIIFLTSVFCFDNLIMLIDNDTATIVCNPSGTAATINTILVTNASMTSSSTSPPCVAKEMSCTVKTIAAAVTPNNVIALPSQASFSCKGVVLFSVIESSLAIWPNSVLSPTAVINKIQEL